MKLILFAFVAGLLPLNTVGVESLPDRPAIAQPSCYSQDEECLDSWYLYGDESGDYGVIDQ